MTDYSGLQIDVRCIKCGRLPTTDVTLFEMQNHLYICNICRQQAEQSGKHIKWINDLQADAGNDGLHLGSPTTTTLPLGPTNARVTTSQLPPNSLFAVLNLPITASVTEIEVAIAQRMRQLLREEDAPERMQKIEQLHEWQEKIEDPATFEEYRASFKPTRHTGQALSVGGRLVYDAQAFLSACEDSPQGWADGERYLHLGQLQHWIIFQIEDRDLAGKIRHYQNLKNTPLFRALNEALYCLLPQRPFRLYREDTWQPLKTTPSASTPQELADLCDQYWQLGEHHLYNGSMLYWLEQARGIQGLKAYYHSAVEGYARKDRDRGVGLELLLEKALPGLTRPKLVVTFDGSESAYTLKRWDREIPHKAIAVTVTNATRGFTSVDLVLDPPTNPAEPQWLEFNNVLPVHLAGTPGNGMPSTRTLATTYLPLLKRGRTYRRTLLMVVTGEYGRTPGTQRFPITLSTQLFYQGLRGILWLWGLRGGLTGLAWNFAIGTLLTFFFSLIIPALIPAAYLHKAAHNLSFNTILQMALVGTVGFLHTPAIMLPMLNGKFPLLVGVLIGLLGFGVGRGKGHSDYDEARGSSVFRTGAFWLALMFAFALFFLHRGGETLDLVSRHNTTAVTLLMVQIVGGSLAIGILTFLIALLVAFIRYQAEKYLRTRYQELVNPPGRA